MAPQPRLEGKVAIVTGGASGFGKGIATKFVAEGARVLIADLSAEAGQGAATELGCAFTTGDVTRREDWVRLLREAVEKFGRLDVVVNNAGAAYANKATEEVTDADFDLVMNVNVKSVYLSTNVIVPYFLANNTPGTFIQIASTAAGKSWGFTFSNVLFCRTTNSESRNLSSTRLSFRDRSILGGEL